MKLKKVKRGDTVEVITGKNRGKNGKVLDVDRENDRITVEGVNIVKKHKKKDANNNAGSIIEIEAPIHISNVKINTVSENKNNKKDNKKD